MAFAGDLQHLPVVDIIQLLHSTRRSGTLHLMGPSGESRLVFSEGYIVSANHRNDSIRLGQVLVGMNALSQAELDATLATQKADTTDRRQPLIAILVESGKIDKGTAQKGLETLIVMTIIDVLTWPGGTFTLDVDSVVVSDEYRYFPEKLQQDFYVSTQNVLMDALRLFDEKNRDGALADGVFPRDGEAERNDTPGEDESVPGVEISVDLLGLDELDRLDKKIPDVFRGLRLEDPTEAHRKILGNSRINLPPADTERLIDYLVQHTSVDSPPARKEGGRTIILFSRDELLKHAVTTLCKGSPWFSFNTDDEASLDLIIEQSLSKDSEPLLLIDTPVDGGDFTAEMLADLTRRKFVSYPELAIVRLLTNAPPLTQLSAIREGALTILPKPDQQQPEHFVDTLLLLLETIKTLLNRTSATGPSLIFSGLITTQQELLTAASPQDVSLLLAKFIATTYERSLTLISGEGELVAERGFGIHGDKTAGPTPPLKFRLPLAGSTLLRELVASGRCHWGSATDPGLATLYSQISAPRSNHILLLPLRLNGRTIAVIYGDFGPRPAGKGYPELMETLARQAGLVLESIFLRKKGSAPTA